MSYVGYGQSPYVQEPKIRFDAIGEAWGLVREKLGVWVLTTLIVGGGGFLVSSLIGAAVAALFGVGGTATVNPANPFGTFTPLFVTANILSVIIGTGIGAVITACFYRLALKQVRGEDIKLSDAFSPGENVPALLLTNLIVGFLTFVGGVLCYVPGIIVAVGTMFAGMLTVDRGLTGLDPVSRSWEGTKGQRLNGFLLILVLGLLMGVSAIPVGLGLLVSVPVATVTLAIIYRDLFDTEGTLRGATLAVPLPPASAYGAGAYNAPPAPARPGEPLPYGQTPGSTGRAGDTGTKPPDTPGQMAGLDM